MFQVLILLKAGAGGLKALRAYEQTIMPIFAEYGGNIITAFSPRKTVSTAQADEIHLLTFPSEADFEAYRKDPRIRDLQSVRAEAISDTIMYVADSFVNYEI